MDNGRIGYENYMVKREELDDIFNQYIKTELDNSVTKILNELPPVYKEIIELLNIPFEKIGDEKYNELIRDPVELTRYFSCVKYFLTETTELQYELNEEKDFQSQKYSSNKSKYIFLDKF